MRVKGQIKVIKKGTQGTATLEPKTERYAEKRESRDMVATVSDWVKELQSRKREESKGTLEGLIGGGPQTSGA